MLQGVGQVSHHRARHIGLNDNAEHGLAGGRVLEKWLGRLVHRVVVVHLVTRNVPMVLEHLVLQVDVVVRQIQLGIEIRRHHCQRVLAVQRVQHDELGPAIGMLHTLQEIPQVLGIGHPVVAQGFVPSSAQTVKFIILDEDAAGGAGEVQCVGIGLAAEIRYGDGDVLAELLPLPPHNPSRPTDALAELVAAGRDRQHVWQAEIPRRHAVLEWRDERARGAVDVDAHLPALLLVQLRQHGIHIPHWVVLAAVMVAQDAHHTDGLVVNVGLHLLRGQSERRLGRRDKLRLDVHVTEQLFPRSLIARGHHQVRVYATNLVFRHTMLLGVPLPPAELQAQAPQQARLGRAHSASSGEGAVLVEVGGLRAVPQVGDHVQDDVVHLETLGVHGLVGQVDPHAQIGGLDFLVLHIHVDIRGGVQTFPAIELVEIRNHPVAMCAGIASGRHAHVVGALGDRVGGRVIVGARLRWGARHSGQGRFQLRIFLLQILDASLRHGAPLLAAAAAGAGARSGRA
mmetsp:Transcript_69018/g.211713  ORF Transcript_69018/g.211713 Transcript_69018/m.211713 type:complete len:512 (+) Transcript_69018:176-1711(+)